MPLIEKVTRECRWCGTKTPHELWHKTRVVQGTDDRVSYVVDRIYKCLRCKVEEKQ